jgi:hypothetical protein
VLALAAVRAEAPHSGESGESPEGDHDGVSKERAAWGFLRLFHAMGTYLDLSLKSGSIYKYIGYSI